MKYHLFVLTDMILAVIALFVALYMSYSALRRVHKIEEELENAVQKKEE